jgi:hypothetical protein
MPFQALEHPVAAAVLVQQNLTQRLVAALVLLAHVSSMVVNWSPAFTAPPDSAGRAEQNFD